MSEEKSTHIVFDGEKIMISPDLRVISEHLSDVDSEVESLFNFQDKLESLRKNFIELFDFTIFLSNKLKEAGIEFEYKMKEDPRLINEKINFDLPVRSYAIVLFAKLEILRTFWTAYKNETSDELKLRDASENSMKLFFDEFCLCKDNEWVKNNPKRKNFSSKNLVDLRNSLTHFFGSGKLNLIPCFDKDIKELQKNYKSLFKVVSIEDLREISKGAFMLALEKWTYDSYYNKKDFKRKIYFVKEITERKAPKIVSREMVKKINEACLKNLKNNPQPTQPQPPKPQPKK